MNRLCADVYLADDNLPFQLNIFLATTVSLAGALILSVVALPFLLIAVLILFVLYYLIQVPLHLFGVYELVIFSDIIVIRLARSKDLLL